jgi:hypothetical protein
MSHRLLPPAPASPDELKSIRTNLASFLEESSHFSLRADKFCPVWSCSPLSDRRSSPKKQGKDLAELNSVQEIQPFFETHPPAGHEIPIATVPTQIVMVSAQSFGM